jgi:hypothetical protein
MKIVFAGVAILLIVSVAGIGVKDRQLVEEGTRSNGALGSEVRTYKEAARNCSGCIGTDPSIRL